MRVGFLQVVAYVRAAKRLLSLVFPSVPNREQLSRKLSDFRKS